MSKVCGTSEEARQLGGVLSTAMKAVEAGISQLEKGESSMRSAWQDDGADVIDEIVSSIKKALKDAQESMPSIQKAIEAYAQFLEKKM